jgi:hypothetical protein
VIPFYLTGERRELLEYYPELGFLRDLVCMCALGVSMSCVCNLVVSGVLVQAVDGADERRAAQAVALDAG